MSNYNSIIVDTPQEKVSRITLNRPKQRNSLSAELRTELFQALENKWSWKWAAVKTFFKLTPQFNRIHQHPDCVDKWE